MTILTAIVVILGIALVLVGLGIAVWSIIDTRKRYYEEYLSRRKRNARD